MLKKLVKLYEGNERFTFMLKYDGQRIKNKRTFICQYNDETIFRKDSDKNHLYWEDKISNNQENLDILKKYLELEEQLILKYGEAIVFVLAKYKDFIKLYLNVDKKFISRKVDVECFTKISHFSLHFEGEC